MLGIKELMELALFPDYDENLTVGVIVGGVAGFAALCAALAFAVWTACIFAA